MIEIMCTLSGEQIADPALVKDLADAGMQAVRINTAHLHGVDELARIAYMLKSLCPRMKVLIDTKGPEMRTTANADREEIVLTDGDRVKIKGSDSDERSSAELLVVNYPDIHNSVATDDTIMIDDGRIELSVVDVIDDVITASVVRGGTIGPRKGLSIVGKEPDLPSVGPHDLEYIKYAAISDDIDVIAHSFVRNAADVEAVKKAMGSCPKPVIAKIENIQGLDNLTAITEVADGILIARGDLTATLGAEAVPTAQARIAAVTTDKGLPLYLATMILSSMISDTVPSADDLSRIEIALRQGVGTMLLTNETATGLHPVECVKVLAEEIRKFEVSAY